MVSNSGLSEIMCTNDDRAATTLFIVDEVVDCLGRREIESCERLVEQQHVVILSQPLGHEYPLALPAGELGEMPAGQVRDRHPLHRCCDDRSVRISEALELTDTRIPAHGHDLAYGDG